MEVAVNFNFDSTSTTPYATAPSSPTIPGAAAAAAAGFLQQQPRYYTSAPTSPSRAAALYRQFRAATAATMASASTPSSPSAVIPFDWEETPGTPKSPKDEEKQQLLGDNHNDDDDDYSVDFAFEFSGQLVHDGALAYTATADELFEAGKIRPLKPPPRLYVAAGEYDTFVPGTTGGSATAPSMSPRSPKSPASAARMFFLPSPRRRRGGRRQGTGAGDDEFVDPFEVAMQEATRGRELHANPPAAADGDRARARRRPSRSLSPLRGLFDFGGRGKLGGDNTQSNKTSTAAAAAATPASTAADNGGLAKGGSGSKKWRLRDLFLFRSASEGRATGDRSKDPLRKYTAASAASGLLHNDRHPDTARGASFRSTVSRTRDGSVAGDSSRRSAGGGDGSVGGSSRRGSTGGDGSVGGSSRRSVVPGAGVLVAPSPHEAHYAANRAVSEELRRKTFLPYRQGLLGCLGFSPGGGGAGLARGLTSVGATVSSRRY